MSDYSRRRFLAQSSLTLGAAALAPRVLSAAETTSSAPSTGAPAHYAADEKVTLGRSGIQTSLLGLGTGFNGWRRSSAQLRRGPLEFNALVRHAYDRGLRYFDTADQYGTHIYLREALKGIDRSDIYIQTKTRATHPEVLRADVDRYREELGADRLDCLLLHCMTSGTWPNELRAVIDALHECKEKGKVRAIGVSCHGWDPLVTAVDQDWIDIQLARINPFGEIMDSTPERVAPQLAKMHAAGRGVIGMKICANGKRTTADDRAASLRYVLGLGSVNCFTIGFETIEELDEVYAQIAAVPRRASDRFSQRGVSAGGTAFQPGPPNSRA